MDEQESEAYLDVQDYQDQVDNNEDQQAQYEDSQWEQNTMGEDIPTHRKPDNLYTLFQKVWAAKDSSKVGNLDKYELGQLPIKVRDAQYLALLGKTLKHDRFADFWNAQGEIILSTSASKKGWFTELFVSQKKFTERSSQGFSSSGNSTKKKWSLFGNNQATQQDNSQ